MSVIVLLDCKLKDIEKLIHAAADLCHDGEFLEALDLYDRILAKQPEHLDAIIDK